LRSQREARSIWSPCDGRPGASRPAAAFRPRKPIHLVIFAWVCAVSSASAGCSGQSNFLTGGPTVGQLKTSLSHLEYENEQLKRKTAKLEQENRSIEDRLVQEQIDNGDLTARLDDARNLLRDRGVEPDVKLGSRRRGEGDDRSAEDGGRARTLPTGRATRERRKPPFAQISDKVEVVPPIQDGVDRAPASRNRRKTRIDGTGRGADDVSDHHSFNAGPLRWLPVADASGDPAIQVR
jgi:hypothetical protein